MPNAVGHRCGSFRLCPFRLVTARAGALDSRATKASTVGVERTLTDNRLTRTQDAKSRCLISDHQIPTFAFSLSPSRSWSRGHRATPIPTLLLLHDLPDAAALVVAQVERAIGSVGEADGTMGGAFGAHHPAGESAREHGVVGGQAILELQEDDVIAVLRQRRAKRRAVERDERAALVRRRETSSRCRTPSTSATSAPGTRSAAG